MKTPPTLVRALFVVALLAVGMAPIGPAGVAAAQDGAPQNGWAANDPAELGRVLETLEGIRSGFSGAQAGGKRGRR